MFFKNIWKVFKWTTSTFRKLSLSELMSAYRSGYNANHVLIRLIENWRHALHNNLFTCAVLMKLSKAFDCILHDLLIAKLNAYGLDFDTKTFLHNYLKHRKQSVKINNLSSFFRTILSVVTQGSMLSPINPFQNFYKWLVLMANKTWFI